MSTTVNPTMVSVSIANQIGTTGQTGVSKPNTTDLAAKVAVLDDHVSGLEKKMTEIDTKLDKVEKLLTNLGSDTGDTKKTEALTSGASSGQSRWKVDKENKTIELDNGYKLSFNESNSQLQLKEANGDSVNISGDPHLDIGSDGKLEADFKKTTTMFLKDGTKITIDTATPDGSGTGPTYADKITITKGDQCVKVSGLMNGGEGMKIGDVTQDGKQADAATADGYKMFEGSEDNSWKMEDGSIMEKDSAFRQFAWDDYKPTADVEWKSTDGREADGPGLQGIDKLSPEMRAMLEDLGIKWDMDDDNELDQNEINGIKEQLKKIKGSLTDEQTELVGQLDNGANGLNNQLKALVGEPEEEFA